MPRFILINPSERKIFFEDLKSKIDSSWEAFYPKYNISRSMFFNYLSGRYFIPKKLFWRWVNEYSLKIPSIKEKVRPKYTRKKILKANLDEQLSEFIGAVNGDGHVAASNYEVCIVCDAREKDYLIHLNKIARSIFGTSFCFLYEPTRIKLRIYSKDIHKFLIEEFGLPVGNKLGKLKIPLQIKPSKKLLIAYIRGLFDTDGSFYLRRGKDPVVEITSADENFLNEVKGVLALLGFNPSNGKNRTFLYRKEDILRFFNRVKPANSKHLKKYQSFLNL